mgnify:CR=1 FL=1
MSGSIKHLSLHERILLHLTDNDFHITDNCKWDLSDYKHFFQYVKQGWLVQHHLVCGFIVNPELEGQMPHDFVEYLIDIEDGWEYNNYNCDKSKDVIRVAGGGMMNGNAYANVEKIDGLYYYCEYGKNPKKECIGDTIVYDPYGYEYNFNVITLHS